MILTLNDKLKEGYYKPVEKRQLIDTLLNVKTEYVKKKGGKPYCPDYQTKITQDLKYVEDNLTGEYSHKNYIEYLLGAWDAHWGIVVNPDILWYTALCELP